MLQLQCRAEIEFRFQPSIIAANMKKHRKEMWLENTYLFQVQRARSHYVNIMPAIHQSFEMKTRIP